MVATTVGGRGGCPGEQRRRKEQRQRDVLLAWSLLGLQHID